MKLVVQRRADDVNVPAHLLLAPLPPWVKMVWISIRQRGESCTDSYSEIGQTCVNANGNPTDKGNVARAVRMLMEEGLLYRKNDVELVCVGGSVVEDTTDRPEQTRKGMTVVEHTTDVPEQAKKGRSVVEDTTPPVVEDTTPRLKSVSPVGGDYRGGSSKVNSKKDGYENGGESEGGWKIESWQHQYSVRLAERLRELETLHAEIARATPQRFEAFMQDWCDVFDKLERLDGHSKDAIANVLRWLLREENWWIAKKAIRSATKFRDKHADGEKYFDKMLAQMGAVDPKLKVDLTQPVSSARMFEAIGSLSITRDDFYDKGKDWRGEPLFMLKVEKRNELGL